MPMTPDEFHRTLLLEQYGEPVPQWQPTVDDLIAAAERIRLLELDSEQVA